MYLTTRTNDQQTNTCKPAVGRPLHKQTTFTHTSKQWADRHIQKQTHTSKRWADRYIQIQYRLIQKRAGGACKQAVGRPLQIKTRPTDTNKLGGTILFTKSFQAWDDDLARFAENRPPKLDNNVWLTFGAFQDVVAMNLCIISYDLPTPAHASTAWNNLKILAPAIPLCHTQCIASAV